MIFTTTITQKGQITIPKKMREVLGLSPKQRVEIKLNPKDKTIKVASIPDFLELAGGLSEKIPKNKRLINPVDARSYMDKNYERV